MSQLLNKILLKCLRTVGSDRLMGIKRGVLKNFKWSVSIPDNRYILGIYEEDLANRVKTQVGKGKRFIDIGANAGYFSIVASQYGDAEINHIAVEPFPANVNLLKAHLKSNSITNVVVEEIAIADKSGELEFSNTSNLAANTYKSESSIFTGDVIKVQSETLDAFAKRNNLTGDCFLKIDVEGAEFDVLSGGKEYLIEYHPDLVLATHDCHVKGVKKACLDLLTSIGYKYEVIDDVKIDGQEDFLCTRD